MYLNLLPHNIKATGLRKETIAIETKISKVVVLKYYDKGCTNSYALVSSYEPIKQNGYPQEWLTPEVCSVFFPGILRDMTMDNKLMYSTVHP